VPGRLADLAQPGSLVAGLSEKQRSVIGVPVASTSSASPAQAPGEASIGSARSQKGSAAIRSPRMSDTVTQARPPTGVPSSVTETRASGVKS